MSHLVQCPNGTVYDAAAHTECPCLSCWAERSSGNLTATGSQRPSTVPSQPASAEAAASAPAPSPARASPAIHSSSREPRIRPRRRARDIIIGAGAAFLLVAGGLYGVTLWIERQVTQKIDAAFDDMRAAFGSAQHGSIELSLWSRTVKITDILLGSHPGSAATVKIRQVAGTGVSPSSTQVFSSRVDIEDWEYVGNASTQSRISLKAPKVTLEALSTITERPRTTDDSLPLRDVRAAVAYLAASSLGSLTIPSLSMNVGPIESKGPADLAEYRFSNLKVNGVGDGRVAAMSIDRVSVAGVAGASGRTSFSSEIEGISFSDFDATTLAAFLGPPPQKDAYRQLLGGLSIGPLTTKSGAGETSRLGGFTLTDFGVNPSKLSWSGIHAFMESLPAPGASVSPVQQKAQLEKVAQLYGGTRIRQLEWRDLAINTPPPASVKLAKMRLSGLDDGRLAEFMLEGLDIQSPNKEAFGMGRLTLKELGLGRVLRAAAISQSAPAPDQIAELLTALEGIEVMRFTVSDKKSGQLIQVERLEASWGRFVGTLPSSARVNAKIIMPTKLSDDSLFKALADAGIHTLTYSLEFGGSWNEQTRTLTFSPAVADFEGLLVVSASLALKNAASNLFVLDPVKFRSAAESLEAGPLDLSLRDRGGLDLWIRQVVKTQGISPTAARQTLIGNFQKTFEAQSQARPDIQLLVNSVTRFMGTSGQALTIKLIPSNGLKADRLIEALKADPAAALSEFKVEASVAR